MDKVLGNFFRISCGLDRVLKWLVKLWVCGNGLDIFRIFISKIIMIIEDIVIVEYMYLKCVIFLILEFKIVNIFMMFVIWF